jgi:hypothetical protein
VTIVVSGRRAREVSSLDLSFMRLFYVFSGSNSLRGRPIWLFPPPFRHFRAFSAFVNPLTSYGDRSQMIADG